MPEARTGASKRIAVIDDDESVRESLPHLLELFGFKVTPFASAEDFLDSGAADNADCLILDVTMPGMSGPDLQEELKRRNNNVPIIFISANSAVKSWPALTSSGAAACLIKPFSEGDIRAALNLALGLA
jgi:FixJ family two-component response regulator